MLCTAKRRKRNERTELKCSTVNRLSFPHTFHMYNMPKHIYSWNLGICTFEAETWQMPQYVTNVKSADLCQYDVQSTTASRTGSAVRVFATKSTRNQMKIDSPDDRSTRLRVDCRDCRPWQIEWALQTGRQAKRVLSSDRLWIVPCNTVS